MDLPTQVTAMYGYPGLHPLATQPDAFQRPPVRLPDPVREQLGRLVHLERRRWAQEQLAPSPAWLMPWEDLREPDREVDRLIGERLVEALGAFNVSPTLPAKGNAKADGEFLR